MKKRVNISLSEEIAEQLKEVAEKTNRNVSQWITDRVMEAVDANKNTIEEEKSNGSNN